MKSIDLLGVLFASGVYFAMYLFWHSKYFFGKMYPKQTKEKRRRICSGAITFISILVMTFGVALMEVLLGVSSFWDGVFLGFLIWIGFIATHSVFLAVSIKGNWKIYIIDNILYFLGLMIVAGILAG